MNQEVCIPYDIIYGIISTRMTCNVMLVLAALQKPFRLFGF